MLGCRRRFFDVMICPCSPEVYHVVAEPFRTRSYLAQPWAVDTFSMDRHLTIDEQAHIIFCCEKDMHRATKSGLFGTLQKFGYTEGVKIQIESAFRQSIDGMLNGLDFEDLPGLNNEIGIII